MYRILLIDSDGHERVISMAEYIRMVNSCGTATCSSISGPTETVYYNTQFERSAKAMQELQAELLKLKDISYQLREDYQRGWFIIYKYLYKKILIHIDLNIKYRRLRLLCSRHHMKRRHKK